MNNQITLKQAIQLMGSELLNHEVATIFLSQDFFGYNVPFGHKSKLGEGLEMNVAIQINNKPVFVVNNQHGKLIAFHMRDNTFKVTDFIEDINYTLNFKDFKSLML